MPLFLPVPPAPPEGTLAQAHARGFEGEAFLLPLPLPLQLVPGQGGSKGGGKGSRGSSLVTLWRRPGQLREKSRKCLEESHLVRELWLSKHMGT